MGATMCSNFSPAIADAGSLLYVNGCDLEALSASTGAVAWHSAGALGPDAIAPAVAGNLVFGSTSDAGIAAFNATTGKLVWQDTKILPGGTTIANGVVYVEEATSIVMLNSSTGAQLGRLQAPSGCQDSGDAVPVDGHVYVPVDSCTSGANLRLIAYVP
jgi:outer membrane protein assembly factor BamB